MALANRPIMLALVAFSFLWWLIALAGVSALQSDCHSFTAGTCRSFLGLPWWIIWFEFFMLLVLAAVILQGLHGFRFGVLILFGVLATLTTIYTDYFFTTRDAAGGNDSLRSRADTAVAGFLVLTICNLLICLLYGTEGDSLEGIKSAAPVMGPATATANTNTHHNPIGMAPAASPPAAVV